MGNVEYTAGFIDFNVYRDIEREPFQHVVRVELPHIFSPVVTVNGGEYPPLTLKLYFASIKDAAEAMEIPGLQMITVRAAEEYFDVEEAVCGVRRIKHVMEARPRILVPGSVFTWDAKAPLKNGAASEKSERAYTPQINCGCGAVCEYDVAYYTAFCEEKKLWEILPYKRICTIGGTQYPFQEDRTQRKGTGE